MSKGEKILYCVLNWGLGHATRSEPLIRKLLASGASVELASDGNALLYLRNAFPGLLFHELPSYNIRYGKNAAATTARLLWQMLPAHTVRRREQQMCEKLCSEKDFTQLISDGRFGCYSHKTFSVYITHQLCPQTGNVWANLMARHMHARIMNRFDEVWVPDHTEPHKSLSGKLSAPNPFLEIPVRYIGTLSRFGSIEPQPQRFDALAVLSGPEPQRSILERLLLKQMTQLPDKKFALVRGVAGEMAVPPNVQLYQMLQGSELLELISSAKLVVCRSGYSGIMDQHAMQKEQVLLVPTPGQYEQVYLAQYLQGRAGWKMSRQNSQELNRCFTDL